MDNNMFGLPLELITMLFSTVLGGVMSLIGQNAKNKAEQQKALIGAVNEAREHGSKDLHFAWTRRIIALSAVFAIIVLPKMVAVWYPDVSVIVGYTEVHGGLFNWLFGGDGTVQWQAARGFVITPLDTHIVSAIVGLYFGAGFTKQENKMKTLAIFDQPIPGQSLTGEPKNNPWEQPAEMSSVEDVTMFYIESMANQDVIDDLAAVCQAGLSLKRIVNTIVGAGTMNGIHSVDVAMLVKPIIHEFLKQAITSLGVEVSDDGKDYQKEAEDRELQRFQAIVGAYIKDNPDDGSDPGKRMLSDLVEEEPEEEDTPEEKPMGLMAKGL